MEQQEAATDRRRRLPAFVAAAAVLFVLLNLVRWGGSARGGPLLVVGVAALLGLVVAFGVAGWWLLASPLPPDTEPLGPRLHPVMRQAVGALIVAAGLMFSIGLLWDEIWHRRYGGFGDDFLWPPHMLLYTSIGVVAGIGVWGLTGLRGAAGGVRERVRGEPIITLISLLALYLAFSAPSDALWHEIYGIDLTAWSLPHLLLFGGMAVVLSSSILLLRSGVGTSDWRTVRGLGIPDALSILVGGMALSLTMQLGTTEWDDIDAVPDVVTLAGPGAAFWARPEWLYPVVLVTIGFLTGTMILHALRRVGSATLIGFVTIGLRLVAIGLFDGFDAGVSLTSQLLILVPLVAVDVAAAYQFWKGGEVAPSFARSAIVAAVSLAMLLPLVAAVMVYPRVSWSTSPPMVIWGVVLAVGSAWLGATIGDYVHRQSTVDRSKKRAAPALVGLLTAVAIVALVTAVATPPSN